MFAAYSQYICSALSSIDCADPYTSCYSVYWGFRPYDRYCLTALFFCKVATLAKQQKGRGDFVEGITRFLSFFGVFFIIQFQMIFLFTNKRILRIHAIEAGLGIRSFAHSLIAHSLIRSFRYNQTVSDSLRSLKTKERPWANRLGRSEEMSDRERFAQVSQS